MTQHSWMQSTRVPYTGIAHAATRCNTLQHTVTHCNTLQHTATHYNTLQHTGIAHYMVPLLPWCCSVLQCVADSATWQSTHPCSAEGYHMQATHCSTLQHTATHCNTLQHAASWQITQRRIKETRCNTLQHTATYPISPEGTVEPAAPPRPQIFPRFICNTTNLSSNLFTISTQHNQHVDLFRIEKCIPLATHCNTLQHTATHCNTLQHTATHCNTLQHIPLVTHVIGPRKKTLTKTFGTQSPYLTARRGGHERKPPIRPVTTLVATVPNEFVRRVRDYQLSIYGVATISRLLKIIGLFCKRALWKRLYSAKET